MIGSKTPSKSARILKGLFFLWGFFTMLMNVGCSHGAIGGNGNNTALCLNGTVDSGEKCDGNCPASCDDGNVCTTDTLTGSAAKCDAECSFVPITSCTDADGCCPSGCTTDNDSDCATYLHTYYVSNSGSDSAAGTTTATAWKTIAKVNSQTFVAGDGIFFERGGVWRELLTVPSSGTPSSYITFGSYGSATSSNPRILGSTQLTGWTNVSGSIWKSSISLSSAPETNVFFDKSGVDYWGTNKSSTANLTAEFQWTYSSNYIYIYSAADPSTIYTAVEVPVRESTVNMNQKNYIHFNEIDMLYAIHSGYGYDLTHHDMHQQYGLIIENSEIGCMGVQTADGDTGNEVGYGIEVVYSDMIIRNNEVHDCGRRNLSMDMYGDGYTATNILIEGNDLYNGFHTTGIDIDIGANYTANIDGMVIRNNFIHEKTLSWDGDVSNLIFIQNNNSANASITNIYIYNNIFKYANGYGILMENISNGNVYIYHNVFYKKNTNVSWAPHVAVQSNSRATVKNNIFYEAGLEISSSYVTNDYNLYYNASSVPPEINKVTGNPLFVDGDGDNFRLQSASPAINKGVDVGITTDRDGNSRVEVPDIGAYEYVP